MQEPVNDHTAFDPTLAVEDEYNLGEARCVELVLDNFIAISDVLSGIIEIPLD